MPEIKKGNNSANKVSGVTSFIGVGRFRILGGKV